MLKFPMAAAIVLLAGGASAQMAPDRAAMLERMDARAGHFGDVSRKIWEFAEVGYKETKSSAMLRDELRQAGFSIEENIGGIPTAFSASWGQGKPVIGILGEFDALPGLSQEDVPEQKPRVTGDPGHGCGHNLFGTASAFAAISVKNYLSEKKLPGTIVFYGTPAEEGGGGKVYMARAGAFNRCDAIITWHPGNANQVSNRTSLANITGKFKFYGKPSHAAAAPDAGRSALDGLMLMNFCVEMMREHVPQETRMHYIVTNGGAAPNVVPAFSEGYFYARHSSMPVLDNVWERINKCAQAGALGTETRMELDLVSSVYNVLPNPVLGQMLEKNLRALGGIHYTPEEQAFAQQLRKSFNADQPLGSQENVVRADDGVGSASSDVGDVSWNVPTAQFTTATFVPGTPGHSWQSAACAGTTIGRKGMVLAAKTLALTAADLFGQPDQVIAARQAFEKARAGHEYRSRIPADHKPPLNYRDKSAN